MSITRCIYIIHIHFQVADENGYSKIVKALDALPEDLDMSPQHLSQRYDRASQRMSQLSDMAADILSDSQDTITEPTNHAVLTKMNTQSLIDTADDIFDDMRKTVTQRKQTLTSAPMQGWLDKKQVLSSLCILNICISYMYIYTHSIVHHIHGNVDG